MSIDLNSDVGESFGAYRIGADAEVMRQHHVGERRLRVSRGRSGSDARRRSGWPGTPAWPSARIPGFPDLVGFGRRELRASPREVEDLVLYQIGALAAIAASEGVAARARQGARRALQHGGARSRAGRRDRPRRRSRSIRSLILFGLPGSELLRAGEAAGLRVASEGFADRAYEPDGSLAPRTAPGSVIHDPDEVVARARSHGRPTVEVTATDGSTLSLPVDTLCVHGDTPGAAELTRRLRDGLEQRGVAVRACRLQVDRG